MRVWQRLLRNPLSLMLARGEIDEGDTVAVSVRDGSLNLAKAGLASEGNGGD